MLTMQVQNCLGFFDDRNGAVRSRVSVIIPTFNRAALIGETIESLLSQDRKPDEILVIDDGSSDDTQQVLAGYGEMLRVHHQENSGKAKALNRALKMVTGDLIWIVDDDDILLPHACAALAGALEADPLAMFCAGRHCDFERDPETGEHMLRPAGYMRDSAPDEIFPHLLEGCHIFQPGLMVRRAAYEAVGGFREDLMRSQDYEMILRLSRRLPGVQLDQIVFHHREHEGARGEAGKEFAAQQNAERWAAFNRRIFTEIFDGMADRELFGPTLWAQIPDAERPRLIEIAKATVFARQRMWPEAMAHLHAAAKLGDAPLSTEETARLQRLTLSTLGAPELIEDPALQAQLRALGRLGPTGKRMRAILKRSMLWQLRRALRERNLPQMWRIASFFVRS
ncbi:glycosyl transferase family 2 [Thioclava sp. ES.031]|nr:glycosyl transferase family 2 [Thioclava sp. ES.031]